MAAQAMPVLDQEQLLMDKVVTPHRLLPTERMVAWHRYDDWIFRDLHRLDIAKFVRNRNQQNVEFSSSQLLQQGCSRSLPHIELELRQRSSQVRDRLGKLVGVAGAFGG